MQLSLLEENSDSSCGPFLRWAGGKSWFTKRINDFLPSSFNNYIEPFLGGASVYFYLQNRIKKAVLADINNDLIITYNAIKDDVDSVIKELKKFKNEKEFYYEIRSKKYDSDSKIAAQFIYLNKTSFNGIYRVNRSGKYNVPYGNNNYRIINSELLTKASKCLAKASIRCQDFEESLKKAKKGDLVFIDPPYTVAHENNGFIAYNQKIFTLDDQIRLAKCVKDLHDRGVHYILTNAKHHAINEIYSALPLPFELKRQSLVGGRNATRGLITEYIFTNTIKIS